MFGEVAGQTPWTWHPAPLALFCHTPNKPHDYLGSDGWDLEKTRHCVIVMHI